MKKIMYLFAVILFIGCTDSKIKSDESEWKYLLDENLSLWDNYLSFQYQAGYDGSQPKDESGNLIEPIGLNNPNYNVFEVIEDEREILRISGEYYGCLVTKEEYANYHFQLKFKWGEKKWGLREKKLKDSGILYHSIGPHGAEYFRSWMLSQEFQVMEGHTGDYWTQANSEIDIRAYTSEFIMNPMANETQDFLPIGVNEKDKYYCLRSNNFEKKNNEWNTLDLICFEDKALHIVNGEIVMILKNSRYLDEDGTKVPLIKGKIQIQSEASEIFYKDIKIKSLNVLPNKYQQYF